MKWVFSIIRLKLKGTPEVFLVVAAAAAVVVIVVVILMRNS